MRLCYSNRLEVLAAELAALMRREPGDPFAPERIVVPHPTIGRWLSLKLAHALGIAANVRFELPAEFAWSIMRGVVRELSREQPFSPSRLRWRIHDVLPEFARERHGTAVRGYLADGDPRKRFELADRLARVFDRCLLYRPDWIREWERGATPHWQARLWQVLVGAGGDPGAPGHWVAAIDTFRNALRADPLPPTRPPARLAGGPDPAVDSGSASGPGSGSDAARAGWPRRASFFAVPALSPSYLQMLCEAGREIELHLFMLNPCREYWGDIHSRHEAGRRTGGADPGARYLTEGNELLAAWGRAGRDTFDAFVEIASAGFDERFEPPQGGRRLAAVQRDLLDLRLASEGAEADRRLETEEAATLMGVGGRADDSIQIHVCHSPMREAEVLHDQLLRLFDDHDDLEPADVLVLTPALDVYRSAIEAVFGAVGRIPLDAGPPGGGESRTLRAFLDLLDLPGSRLGAEAVLAPLDAPAVRARFGIGEGDLPAVRGLVREAGVRWGADEAHRGAEGLPETAGHTWRQGLRRLLLGYAMPDANALVAGIVPCPAGGMATGGLDGGEADGELIGRFVSYCEAVFDLRHRFAGERGPAAWADTLHGVVRGFLTAGPEPGGGARRAVGAGGWRAMDEVASEVQAVRAFVRDFAREAEQAGSPAPFSIVRDVLHERARAVSRDAMRLADGVAVTALAPGRIFPAEVVCVLGMNDGAFPRSPSFPSFDVVAAGPARRGDRDVRHEDRFAFLEALLAARRCFLVTYTGRGLRDDAPTPPSVLVDEWKDYLGRRFPGATVETRHPLQPFSPRYFTAPEAEAPERTSRGAEKALDGAGNRAVEAVGDGEAGAGETAGGATDEAANEMALRATRGASDAAALPATDVVAGATVHYPMDRGSEGMITGTADRSVGGIGEAAVRGAANGTPGSGSGVSSAGREALFSYSAGMCEAARAMLAGEADPGLPGRFAEPLPAPDESRRRLDLADLLSFFAHPTRVYLRDRLGVRLEVDDATLDEEEPFEIDGLERYRIRSEVWTRMRAGAAPERTEALLSGSGRLPQAGLGRIVHEREREEAERLEGQLAPYRSALDAPPVAVDLEIGGFRVVGALEQIGPDGTMVWWRLGRLRARDRIEIWLRLLVGSAVGGGPMRALGISREGSGRQSSWRSTPFSTPDDARAQLERWLHVRWRGLATPLPFFPESSLAYASGIARPGSLAGAAAQEAARIKARVAWLGNDFQPGSGERNDPYLRLIHDGDPPLTAEFENLAVELLVPLMGGPTGTTTHAG